MACFSNSIYPPLLSTTHPCLPVVSTSLAQPWLWHPRQKGVVAVTNGSGPKACSKDILGKVFFFFFFIFYISLCLVRIYLHRTISCRFPLSFEMCQYLTLSHLPSLSLFKNKFCLSCCCQQLDVFVQTGSEASEVSVHSHHRQLMFHIAIVVIITTIAINIT